MYLDLSLAGTNSIELRHLLKGLPNQSYNQVALDYSFKDEQIKEIPQDFKRLKEEFPQLTIHSRATLEIDLNPTLQQLSQNQNVYDIVAVRPKNEKIFHALCVEYDNYDVICVEMGTKLPFMLKRNPVYEAIRKGKFFEIQYDCMFQEDKRLICMTNIVNLIKATKGSHLVVSSHSGSSASHRTPFDVAALLTSLGMSKQFVLAAMKQNPMQLLRAAAYRRYFKGAIKEIPAVVKNKISKNIQKHRKKLRGLLQE